jgi:hypothetical protein
VPAGALYGYNVSLDTELSPYFPPTPLAAHAFYRDGELLVDDDSVYVLDENGLWWLSGTGPNVGAPALGAPLTLWITQLTTQLNSVVSLSPNETDADAILPVILRNTAGAAASFGELLAGLESFFPISTEQDEGGIAFKSVDGITVKQGPVVARVIPGDNVTIESSLGDAESGFYGPMTLHVGTTGGVVGQPQIASLENAIETLYQGLPVVSLPANRTASIRYTVAVPTNVQTNSTVKLVLDLIGTTAAVAEDLDVSARRIQDGVDIPTADTALTALSFDLTNQRTTTVETDTVSVNPGDTVSFEISVPTAKAFAIPILKSLFVVAASS